MNIAAYLDKCDRAVIVSGDTDLIPAIKAVRATFPQKQIGVIISIGTSSEDLLKHVDSRFRMREYHQGVYLRLLFDSADSAWAAYSRSLTASFSSSAGSLLFSISGHYADSPG